MPKRIQRKRTRGWKMPPNCVYVGRPTKWGNPYIVGCRLTMDKTPMLPEEAVEHYRMLWPDSRQSEVRAELRGKDLCCWCPLVDKDGNTVPCHADILLEIANAD
jgi:Domain of unknown function (DUF4326)